MKLKNNKGYVTVDVTIAVIVLLILVPTIMGLVFNINLTKNRARLKAEALSIAMNALEASKELELSEITSENIVEILGSEDDGVYNGKITENGDNVVITTDNASYKLQIDVEDYSDTHEGAQANIVKTITAIVTYKSGGNEENIKLSTVLKR